MNAEQGREKAEEAYRQLAETCGQHSTMVDCREEIVAALAKAHEEGRWSLAREVKEQAERYLGKRS